jgi:F-type H+-transporting ATPase subunit b
MKRVMINRFFLAGILLVVCLLSGTVAFAQEGSSWRGTYDTIMMWVNFSILAFLFFKYAKDPLINFLRGQREEVAYEIKQMEEDKAEALKKIAETRTSIAESDAQFQQLKQKIIDDGERKKNVIIDDAREQAQVMVEMARQRIGNQIVQAKARFREELVDTAIDIATTRLPKQITETDSDRMVADYLKALSQKAS